jgi:excisionase family DNA binding protein
MNRDEQSVGEDTLLTVREVSRVLRVSINCVYNLINQGKLPCYRIGASRGAIRVQREDLNAYLATCRREKGEEVPRLPHPRLKHLSL